MVSFHPLSMGWGSLHSKCIDAHNFTVAVDIGDELSRAIDEEGFNWSDFLKVRVRVKNREKRKYKINSHIFEFCCMGKESETMDCDTFFASSLVTVTCKFLKDWVLICVSFRSVYNFDIGICCGGEKFRYEIVMWSRWVQAERLHKAVAEQLAKDSPVKTRFKQNCSKIEPLEGYENLLTFLILKLSFLGIDFDSMKSEKTLIKKQVEEMNRYFGKASEELQRGIETAFGTKADKATPNSKFTSPKSDSEKYDEDLFEKTGTNKVLEDFPSLDELNDLLGDDFDFNDNRDFQPVPLKFENKS